MRLGSRLESVSGRLRKGNCRSQNLGSPHKSGGYTADCRRGYSRMSALLFPWAFGWDQDRILRSGLDAACMWALRWSPLQLGTPEDCEIVWR